MIVLIISVLACFQLARDKNMRFLSFHISWWSCILASCCCCCCCLWLFTLKLTLRHFKLLVFFCFPVCLLVCFWNILVFQCRFSFVFVVIVLFYFLLSRFVPVHYFLYFRWHLNEQKTKASSSLSSLSSNHHIQSINVTVTETFSINFDAISCCCFISFASSFFVRTLSFQYIRFLVLNSGS